MKIKLAVAIGVALLVMLGATAFAWAQDDEGPTSSVRVVVVRDTDGSL